VRADLLRRWRIHWLAWYIEVHSSEFPTMPYVDYKAVGPAGGVVPQLMHVLCLSHLPVSADL
jgi:hypothetical protein